MASDARERELYFQDKKPMMNRTFFPDDDHDPHIDGQNRITLLILERAAVYAGQLGRELREFAVSFSDLANYGATPSELSWLLTSGYVQTVAPLKDQEQIVNSRFLITRLGREVFRRSHLRKKTPRWCPHGRELYLGQNLIKVYRVPSPNQQTVLEVFEEERWPRRIDDPLPPKEGIEIKRRLIETIKSLNRAHQAPGLRFFGDGTGRGVCWKTVD